MSQGKERANGPKQPTTREELLAAVRDVSDVLDLARGDHLGFTVASQDVDAGIVMSTMPVDHCPVHMMKARAVMPCLPADFLKYLEFDVRRLWDEHFSHGHVANAVDDETHFKYMSFHAPIPLLSPRDFELVVFEKYDEATQSWILKAISTPSGMLVPPNAGGKVVRGSILLSGFIIRRVEKGMEPPALSKADACCEVTYIALVHPRGWLPPAFVNLVIGKQTSALRALQTFILKNPVPPASNRGTSSTPSSTPKVTVKSKSKL